MIDTRTFSSGYEKPDKECKTDKYWMIRQSQKAIEDYERSTGKRPDLDVPCGAEEGLEVAEDADE